MITINHFTLSNGLRMVHHRNPSTAMVAVNLLYNTGARDESPDLTGIAHLFEHLMFGGSENIDDFDTEITEAGGSDNAWTSNDFTNFYEVAPAHNAETLFHLESDRMLSPTLSERSVDIQRSIVIEEFKQQCLNVPYGDSSHHLRPMLYGDSHPYSWPVIGKSVAQLETVTRNDMQRWWSDHYTPSNAVLAVTGNISFEKAVELTVKWFGEIPGRAPVPRRICRIQPPPETLWKTVFGPVPATMITVAYLMDAYGTLSYTAADAITDILASGQASRFYSRLIINGDGTFAEAEASITGSEHQGMLMLSGRLADENADPGKAVGDLIAQARTVITEGVTTHELQRHKNKHKSMFVMSCMDYMGLGLNMALAETHNETIDAELNRYLSLTPDDVVSTARHIFDGTNPAVLIYRPETQHD